MLPYHPMKRYSAILLALLLIAVFVIRTGSFSKKRSLTYDEYVYSMLGSQITKDAADYNTRGIYHEALEKGRKLPRYFTKPLFKHPPFFPALLGLNYALFGRTFYAAFAVSLFFGVLLIILVYLFGVSLFEDRTLAVCASLLLAVEPISWICSQKIWMESTLAFFSLLSIYLFALSVKKYHPALIMASGIASGCAALTKYPGILPAVFILLYAAAYERWLFSKKAFLVSLLIPWAMLFPWLYWNYKVFGPAFLSEIYSVHRVSRVLSLQILKKYLPWIALSLGGAAVALFAFRKERLRTLLVWLSIAALLWSVHKSILTVFDLSYTPSTGWFGGMFSKEPWHFYLGRMIELSPFYLFSVIGLFLLAAEKVRGREYALLYASSAFTLLFYIWWRNYQSRYVLAPAVIFTFLSAAAQLFLWRKTMAMPRGIFRSGAQIALFALSALFLFKTLRVDILLAVPNNICYF